MKAEQIAKWVIDNRYNCTTISDEEMYKLVLSEIKSNFKPINTNLDNIRVCSNCKFLHCTELEDPCKSCLDDENEYINHEWE
jgi:hypothetical protein